MHPLLAISLGLFLHLAVLLTLGFHRRTLSTSSLHSGTRSGLILALIVQLGGLCAAGYTFLIPSSTTADGPLSQCFFRIVVFFYGCKILDLALTRAGHPPSLRRVDGTLEKRLDSSRDLSRYAFLLLSEMRYHSFDIAVEQKRRPPSGNQKRDTAFSFLALCALVAVDFFVPMPVSPELKCVCLLLLLQVAFEGLHWLVHSNCGYPLFFQPFSAASASEFWTTHWHAGAAAFLQSLAYRPTRIYGERLFGRQGGRALGVLSTFTLTGIWHGWASAALIDDEYSTVLGLQVWGFFILQGVLCIIERVLWKNKQGGMIQRVLVWALSICAAGQCFRSLQMHTKVPALSRYK